MGRWVLAKAHYNCACGDHIYPGDLMCFNNDRATSQDCGGWLRVF